MENKVELPLIDIVAHLRTIIEQNCKIIAKLDDTDYKDELSHAKHDLIVNKKVIEEYWTQKHQLPDL